MCISVTLTEISESVILALEGEMIDWPSEEGKQRRVESHGSGEICRDERLRWSDH